MPTLPTELRNKLERVVIDARDAAEIGARTALEALAVHHHEPYPHMKSEERKLRNHLRARARQLGDLKLFRAAAGGRDHAMDHLAGECAYEHWHRMLFARFLAENNLLIEPEENMAISLAEAEELAAEVGVDVWVFASRCAQRMLPQIFRPDDPLLQVSFATEHLLKLEKLLASLPAAVFTASDALGWVYQYWQSKKKDEVNRSEVKIGADEIPAVTQLFTEPYMVEFLIHNTLGAWWAGKKLTDKDAANAKTEDELRAKLALPGVTWDYLRFVRSSPSSGEVGDDSEGPWRPAAGTFDGWPKYAKHIKGLDPCAGSGHFLVALFRHLVPIRMIEEDLSTREAADAVLRDNIHGLEIDERCCQIAAFALALAAWTYPEAGGYRPLPELHIACTGIGPQSTEEQWLKLAEMFGMPTKTDERERVKNGLLNLHRLFSQAPTLGSLINPKQLQTDVFAADYETIQPYLSAVLKAEKTDDETHEQTIAAAGMVKAADLLAGKYTLLVTNVPFLARGKQSDTLKAHIELHHKDAKQDLATAFLDRLMMICAISGTVALVTPQNWHYLTSYRQFRETLLQRKHWCMIARLGPAAFQNMNWWAATTQLSIISEEPPAKVASFCDVDASKTRITEEKPLHVKQNTVTQTTQQAQLSNPDARIAPELGVTKSFLRDRADSLQGLATADYSRFGCCFWEIAILLSGKWAYQQSTVLQICEYGGKEHILYWEDGRGVLAANPQARIQGIAGLGKRGVAVSQMNRLCSTLYTGELFDNNTAVIIPADVGDLAAIWAYCSSPDFLEEVRIIDKSTAVTNATLVKVPFNLAHWQEVAAEKYPDGLPEPESDDPTQWLFHGYPYEAKEEVMLQVAAARLLGYRWPAEQDDKMRLSKRARALVKQCGKLAKFADDDGIVCIPAIRGEDPAAERLLQLLNACDVEPRVDLDNWLRNSFFEEHCRLFHDRPFVWHIWDGRKSDGFHALVNYHKLCEDNGKGRRLLESLTYAYLGEWITRQKDGVKRSEEGAEDRLAAALELQKRLESILAGEPPFDIFVRWKPLHEQAIGWEPDINDGVRLNIRPFLSSDLPNGRSGAGILRYKPNIKWTKDRGKEPHRPKEEYPWFWGWDEKTMDFMGGKTFDGNRWNDCHYTNKTKQAARDTAIAKECKK
jgi:hypothetical protein